MLCVFLVKVHLTFDLHFLFGYFEDLLFCPLTEILESYPFE